MSVRGLVSKLSLCTAALMAVSSAASATSGSSNSQNWDVSSDPGSYDPVVLGETIELDACASTYYNANNPSQSYSICDLSSLSKFTLRWKASTDGNSWTWITNTYGANSASNGTNVSMATGSGTFFSTAGTYYIGLYLTVNNNSYVLLPSGGYGYSNSNFNQGNKSTGFSLVSANSGQTPSPSNPPASVPEPASALLLLPGLALMARRDRKRRRTAPQEAKSA
ncbi:MAG: hypothetical protein EP335_16265 [Alphaproteobacteria bacterium]|nr:MAG: hypothetical protein EP335_16265 [Alphaproteobacteria bacterium]